MEGKKMAKVKITIEELEILVEKLKRYVEHDKMKPYVIVTAGKYPNGREYILFEQPSYYSECFSYYKKFDIAD
jgi:hypothetical protein